MNTELGRRVLSHIEQHREQFSMSVWGRRDSDCGTTACLAGWTLLLSGYTLPVWDGDLNQRYHRPDGTVVALDEVANEAMELLEMTIDEFLRFDGLFSEADEETAIAHFRAPLQDRQPKDKR